MYEHRFSFRTDEPLTNEEDIEKAFEDWVRSGMEGSVDNMPERLFGFDMDVNMAPS